jgi:menaquinone-dependent protoporphyrinogen oxidase
LTQINRDVNRVMFPASMARVLMLHATVEGQTARIAARIAQHLRHRGHVLEEHRAETAPANLELAGFDAVIVGASVHYGRHPASLRALVRKYRAALVHRHSAFFSVSLSARSKPQAAQRYLQEFLRQAGWQPQQAVTFAGALPYSRYATWKRLLMRAFVGLAGGDTDASRDYEYTDWHAVDRFAEAFARSLPPE